MRIALAVVGAVLVASGMVSANMPAFPPREPVKEHTLTGSLAWSSVKVPNASLNAKPQPATLTLKQADGQVVRLGTANTLPKTINYEQFVGKQVEVKVMAGKQGTRLLVEKVTDIKEMAPAKP